MKLIQEVKPSRTLEKVMNEFSDKELQIIMKNIGSIQLTEGCSTGCYDCGYEALKGVSDYIERSTVEKIIKDYSKELSKNKFHMYHASDSFDYPEDYWSLHDLVIETIGYNPTVITSVPKGDDERIIRHIFSSNKTSIMGSNGNKMIDVISLLDWNYKRVERVIKEVIPELKDENQIRIKSEYVLSNHFKTEWVKKKGFFGFFQPSKPIKKRIKLLELKNPPAIDFSDGYWNTYFISKGEKILCLPSFDGISLVFNNIEKDNPLVDKLLGQTGDLFTARMPSGDIIMSEGKPIGMEEIMKYCNHKDDIQTEIAEDRRDLKEYAVPGSVSIRNFTTKLDDGLKRRNLGLNYLDNLDSRGIGCFDGVLITPKGFFNIKQVIPSVEYPQGEVRTPIVSGDNFKVNKYKRVYDLK